MKIYLVSGDLSADRQDDITPCVPVCDDCAGGEGIIQEVSDFDSIYGEECYYCGKSREEEDEERHHLDAILSDTEFFNTFQKEILNIRKLNELTLDDQNLEKTLKKQLFVGTIACMETYLSDAFIVTTLSKKEYLKAFVKTFRNFMKEKFELNKIFDVHKEIEKRAEKEMLDVIYHDLPKVKGMYKDTLNITFPELRKIVKSVHTRHDLAHRNGKTKDSTEVRIDKEIVARNLNEIERFISEIDKQLKLLESE